jgi:hypothetical protein
MRISASRCVMALALCLALALGLTGAARAAENPAGPGPATYVELLQWRDAIWTAVRHEPLLNNPEDTYDPAGSATYLLQMEHYTIESITPTLDTDYNPILSVTLNDVQAEGPRAMSLGVPLDAVLTAYENDNPALVGDSEFAALYVYDIGERTGLQEAGWGLLMRGARGALGVEYAVSAPFTAADAYTDIVISYVITDGYVTDMRVRGFGASVLEAELRENIDTVRGIAANTAYDPRSDMPPPMHAEMFGREDLLFADLDFLTATAGDLRALLGAPQSEGPVSAEDGGTAGLCLTYPGLECVFDLDAQSQPGALRSLLISDPGLEGPRGLYIGEPLEDVLHGFRLEDETYSEAQTILYAPEASIDSPPFGLLETYDTQNATVRYAMPAPANEGEGIMLLITVENLRVTEMYLYRWTLDA